MAKDTVLWGLERRGIATVARRRKRTASQYMA